MFRETLGSVLEEITAAGHDHYAFCSPRHQSAKRGHLGLTGSSAQLHPRSSQLMLSGQHHLPQKLKDTHAALFYVEIKFLVIKKQQICHTCTAHKRSQETNQLFQDAECQDVASYVWTCCSRVYVQAQICNETHTTLYTEITIHRFSRSIQLFTFNPISWEVEIHLALRSQRKRYAGPVYQEREMMYDKVSILQQENKLCSQQAKNGLLTENC